MPGFDKKAKTVSTSQSVRTQLPLEIIDPGLVGGEILCPPQQLQPDLKQPIWIYYGNPVRCSATLRRGADRRPAFPRRTCACDAWATGNMDSKTERIIQTLSGSSLYIFWGVLGIVVAGLLLLISRLLPKTGQVNGKVRGESC